MQQAKESYEGVGGANVEYEAETVIATVTGVGTGAGHMQVFLEALCVLTAAAGTTKTTIRIRREGVGGAEVGKMVVEPIKSVAQEVTFQCSDTPGVELANCSYVLTATETAAAKGKSISSRITANV
jgi:hypothetical protein